MQHIDRYSKEFFEALFLKAPQAIFILEGDQIILCSDEAVITFGYYSKEDIIGKTVWTLSPFQQRDGAVSKKKGLLLLSKANTHERLVFDWLHKRMDGSVFDSEVALSRFDIGGRVYIQANLRDISHRKKLENELSESVAKAKQSNQLITSYLANMSHDIRNPLNAILGFSKLLAEDAALSISERQHYGSLIESNGSKLLDLINDIIDVNMIEADQINIDKKRCEVNSLLEELFLTFKKEVSSNPNIKLRLNIAVDDPSFSIFSDPVRIQQILTNLLSNAIKYTEKGFIEFGYQIIDDKGIQFFVKDSGIGIAPEHLENIFNRFSREETVETKSIKGTGLGLDISKRLVGMLGGKIWVFSTLHKGSEFYFSIPAKFLDYKPLIKNKEEVPPKKAKSAHDVDWSDKHILIADDDIINFELLRIILSKTKVKVTKAVNGKEALDLIIQDPSIDLLLTDIQMPIMNGYEVIKEVKKIRYDLPVIAQTAVSLLINDEEKVDVFDDYISKPIDVEALISKIQYYFN